MALHESQSLLIEMQACRSRAFLAFAAPLLRQAFGGDGPAWDAEQPLPPLHPRRAGLHPRRCRRGDLSGPRHPALPAGARADRGRPARSPTCPAPGTRACSALLGIAPPDDRRGCLQDIHWYDGAWGYFPTYTLGAMTAAQLFAARRGDAAHPRWRSRDGDFAPLLGWLRTHVHGKGSSASTRELLIEATGRPLDTGAFQAHLRRRYLGEAELASGPAACRSAPFRAMQRRFFAIAHGFLALNYVSTRGQAPALGFDDVMLAGLARDGGLYVPGELAPA